MLTDQEKLDRLHTYAKEFIRDIAKYSRTIYPFAVDISDIGTIKPVFAFGESTGGNIVYDFLMDRCRERHAVNSDISSMVVGECWLDDDTNQDALRIRIFQGPGECKDYILDYKIDNGIVVFGLPRNNATNS